MSITVMTQDGEGHLGVILDLPHQLPGWCWVDWDHIGVCDEWTADLTTIEGGRP
jgi:hypothetical protein